MLDIKDPKDILAKGTLLFTYDDIPEDKWDKIFKKKEENDEESSDSRETD